MANEGRPEPELRVTWTRGRRRLAEHAEFGPWVKRIGTIRLPVWRQEPFYYLARAICYQQLATKAAETIHGRFVDALGGDVSPGKVLRVRENTLRSAGLSRNKLAAIRDLATKVRSGEVELHDLEEQPDDEVVRRLVQVRGIGEWTAHMYLMFKLRRPDVWPVGDLGVRAGFAKIHGLEGHPTPKELEPLGEGHRPWRSVAAFYCWRALETELS
jgi:3-methyladenine DNA glycosylase/8-oxoguanine DNA glycosylase